MRASRNIAILLLLTYSFCSAKTGLPFSKTLWLNESNSPESVNYLAQDKNSFIWLGTDKGLFRFDGNAFLPVNTIHNIPVTTITTTENNIWIGFNNGRIGQLQNGKFILKTLQGETPESAISAINELAHNVLLIATEGEGVYLINNNISHHVTNKYQLSDNFIYNTVIIGNTLLAATDQGINEINFADKNDLTVNTYTTQNGLPDNIVRVISPMKKKCWSWIGTHQGGLALYCSKKKKIWTPKTNIPWQWGQINDILPMADDHAWVCTESGYLLNVIIEDSNYLSIEAFPYTDNKLKKLLSDKSGNIWCATNTGLKLFTSSYITNIPLSHPYTLSDITAITCSKDNTLWLAQGSKLFRLNNGKLEHYYTAPESITTLYADDENNLWLGTFGQGLYRLQNKAAYKIKEIVPLQHESVLAIEGQDDNIWIAGLNGVEELNVKNGEVVLSKIHNKHSGIGSDYVYQIYNDNSNNIWMATDGAGVCRYKDSEYTLWDTSAGMIGKVIYGITQDVEGNIWASTLNKGLLKYTGNGWENYNREHGLQGLNISTINTTGSGHIVVTHAKGIDVWHPETQDFRHYNRRLGIGIDTVSRQLGLSAKDTNGNVYIPYQGGLIRFNNTTYTQNITPDIYISGISTFFNETSLTKHNFKHAQNHISFYFDGINFVNPEQLFYRYKLEGYNDMWVETSDEAVTFPQLPSGAYNFRVQVSMNSSFGSFSESNYRFTIERPFWQQIWFFILIGMCVWAASYLYIRIREKNIRKLSSLQRERMLFEYEHLKSQVNPHFLFNSLNTLTNLIEDDKNAALQYTNQLSDLYRNMLSFRNKDMITIAEEWEIMENYLYIQQSRFGPALNIDIDVPDPIKATKKIIPMAMQLLVENAIKHNIVSVSSPLNIKIHIDGSFITVENSYQPKISKEAGAGLGLQNIRKRYSLLTNRDISYFIKDDKFIVKLPLL